MSKTYTLTFVVMTEAEDYAEALVDAKDCISQGSWEPTNAEVEDEDGLITKLLGE